MDWTAVHALALKAASGPTNGVSDMNNLPEFKVDNLGYHVVGIYKDMQIFANGTGSTSCDLAARLHIKCVSTSRDISAGADREPQICQIAAHVFAEAFTSGLPDGSLSAVDIPGQASSIASPAEIKQGKVIIDTDSLRKAVELQAAHSPLPLPLCASDVVIRSGDHSMVRSLMHQYQMYIAAINKRNMAQDLPAFCHDIVIHNGRALPLSEYRKLMEDAQAAMAGLEFSIGNVIVDDRKQMVAAKLDFRGTPTESFAGVTPPEGVRKEVRFSEIVFYWFSEGKIAEVVSLVDLDEYRKQTAASI